MQNFNTRVSGLKMNLSRLQNASSAKKAGDDIIKMLNEPLHYTYFSQSISEYADILCRGYNIEPIFSRDINPKVSKRFVQMVGALQRKDYRAVDRTSAISLYALNLANGRPLANDGLFSFVSGLILPTANTRGIERSILGKLFGKLTVSPGTVSTQLSRSFGVNGFGQICGLTYGIPGTSNREFSLNETHPLMVRFLELINGATDGQLDSIGTKD
jgi:hypothetical protein